MIDRSCTTLPASTFMPTKKAGMRDNMAGMGMVNRHNSCVDAYLHLRTPIDSYSVFCHACAAALFYKNEDR